MLSFSPSAAHLQLISFEESRFPIGLRIVTVRKGWLRYEDSMIWPMTAVKENMGHIDARSRMSYTTTALIWSTLAILTLFGDNMVACSRSWVASLAFSPLIPIATDSSIHALISAMLWMASHCEGPPLDDPILSCVRDRTFVGPLRRFSLWIPIFLCACLASSLLDADHFLAAKSWTLFGATHLQGRPVGHSAIFALFAPVCVLGLWRGLQWVLGGGHRRDTSPYWALLVFNAIFSHQLRDAQRRGLMLWSGVSTRPLPRVAVLGVYVGMVLTLRVLLQRVLASPPPPPSLRPHSSTHLDQQQRFHYDMDLEKQLTV